MESSRRLVILASGSGSNAQAVIDACEDGTIEATVVAIVSDQAAAPVLDRARRHGIAAALIGREPNEDRTAYDTRLADAVAAHEPDDVLLLGWMRILTMTFLGRFPGRVLNLHPALPGELPGTHAIERAHAQFVRGERTHTGVMLHLVPDEGVDVGPVIATATVPIHPGDTVDDLAARVHAAEHALVVGTLAIRRPLPKEIHA